MENERYAGHIGYGVLPQQSLSRSSTSLRTASSTSADTLENAATAWRSTDNSLLKREKLE